MANHATLPIPCRDHAMGLKSPHIIMGYGLHNAMAFPAGILGVADTAGGIVLHPECCMAFHPELIVTDRFLITIHINMARQAILP